MPVAVHGGVYYNIFIEYKKPVGSDTLTWRTGDMEDRGRFGGQGTVLCLDNRTA